MPRGGEVERSGTRAVRAGGFVAGEREGSTAGLPTHVRSNIASLTRLTLFVHTIILFLSDVRKNAPEKLAPIAPNFVAQYLDREGYFRMSSVKKRDRSPTV